MKKILLSGLSIILALTALPIFTVADTAAQQVDPDDYMSLANHTFLLTVDAYGPPGGKAKVSIEDHYTK
jgi:hypothetical protein